MHNKTFILLLLLLGLPIVLVRQSLAQQFPIKQSTIKQSPIKQSTIKQSQTAQSPAQEVSSETVDVKKTTQGDLPPNDKTLPANKPNHQDNTVVTDKTPQSPYSFEPSEKISEDLSVAFPVDI